MTDQVPDRPFAFSQQDLAPGRLEPGVRVTLAHFHRWRERSPRAIADHVDRYTEQVRWARSAYRRWPGVRTARRRRRADRVRVERELHHFAVHNLCEVIDSELAAGAATTLEPHLDRLRNLGRELERCRDAPDLVHRLVHRFPVLATVPELSWLAERLDRLHRTLPEVVVGAGSMGKVVRAVAGVLAIGVYDVRDSTQQAAREHLGRVVVGAYALGAAYAVVDDALLDLPRGYLTPAEREQYHRLIRHGLGTGSTVDAAQVPDHPLAEELHDLFQVVLRTYPFDEYRHLYHAAEAMYLAQHRDANTSVEAMVADGPAAMYPDMFIKAGMSRVVANLLGRRRVSDGFYTRCLNSILHSQFKGDLRDHVEDQHANRLTPFTLPPSRAETNPLHDLFAYDAYVAHVVYAGDPVAGEALTYVGAAKLAAHLSVDAGCAGRLLERYEATSEIARFLHAAADLPGRVTTRAYPTDMRMKDRIGQITRKRDQSRVDCRTFIADRLPYLNDLIRRLALAPEPAHRPDPTTPELPEIVAYALRGPAKRLRPALTLMLAEGLGVDRTSLEPLLVASEVLHTASLLFDDLPAQDNASVRRGRPAAHLVFGEGRVQLAALSMISSGFGMLARLTPAFPADRVTDVLGYVGSVLGPEQVCRGQDLDLRLGRRGEQVTQADLLEMYHLKTSTAIEAALVPLMLLTSRSAGETELLKRYAHHAGIVFQLRDDLLDLTASTQQLGKDTGADAGKANLVRRYGVETAERLLRSNLEAAVSYCDEAPFDAELLSGMVHHFATRRR